MVKEFLRRRNGVATNIWGDPERDIWVIDMVSHSNTLLRESRVIEKGDIPLSRFECGQNFVKMWGTTCEENTNFGDPMLPAQCVLERDISLRERVKVNAQNGIFEKEPVKIWTLFAGRALYIT